MLQSFINLEIVTSLVFLFGIKAKMESCQDLIDGGKKTTHFFYDHFDVSWKFILMAFSGMSFSIFPIYVLSFNLLWFLAIQLPNILLYYECIHRPFNLQDPNAG